MMYLVSSQPCVVLSRKRLFHCAAFTADLIAWRATPRPVSDASKATEQQPNPAAIYGLERLLPDKLLDAALHLLYFVSPLFTVFGGARAQLCAFSWAISRAMPPSS